MQFIENKTCVYVYIYSYPLPQYQNGSPLWLSCWSTGCLTQITQHSLPFHATFIPLCILVSLGFGTCEHTHKHAHTHARTHQRSHACTHAHSLCTRMFARSPPPPQTLTLSPPHPNTQTHTLDMAEEGFLGIVFVWVRDSPVTADFLIRLAEGRG